MGFRSVFNKINNNNKNNAIEILLTADRVFNGRAIVSTSFGIHSGVMLHLASRVRPNFPVLFVDTGYMPEETYQYGDLLIKHLGLTNVSFVTNVEWTPKRMEAIHGRLWEQETREAHDLYGKLRKVDPFEKYLFEHNVEAVISGIRKDQTKAREKMTVIEKIRGTYRIHPLLDFTRVEIEHYIDKNNIPRHPLQKQGYSTVGDTHSSKPGLGRSTRFNGKFEECGLHVENNDNQNGDNDIVDKLLGNNDNRPLLVVVKKKLSDGSLCNKCIQVENKMKRDGIIPDSVFFFDVNDDKSPGAILAKHFNITTAPFFLFKSSSPSAEWEPITVYHKVKDKY